MYYQNNFLYIFVELHDIGSSLMWHISNQNNSLLIGAHKYYEEWKIDFCIGVPPLKQLYNEYNRIIDIQFKS